MFCKECGTQLVSDARFCLNCGKALDEVMLRDLEEENRALEVDNLKKEYENLWVNRNEDTEGINGTSIVEEDSEKTVIPVYSFAAEKVSLNDEGNVASTEENNKESSDIITPISSLKPVFMSSVAKENDSVEIESQKAVELAEVDDRSVVKEVEKDLIQEETIAEIVSATEEPSIEQTSGTIAPTAKDAFDEEAVDKILSIISEGNSATAIGFNAINRKLNIILELLKKQEERQAASEKQISEVMKTIKGIKITFEE